MAQLFHPSFNSISKISIVGGVLLVGAAAWAWGAFLFSPYVTGVGVPVEQPVQFSHEHHFSGLGIDCRYCHTSVEKAGFAGIPPVHTCMTCHSQVWADSPYLAPVRQSYQSGIPIRWRRVHDLPGFVYFNHSIHVNKGVGCSECHGRVDLMPLMYKTQTLYMRWCVACHFNPEKFVRPRSEIFNMAYVHPANQAELGAKLVKEYNVLKKVNCTACHR